MFNLLFNKVMLYIMVLCLVIGAVDYLLKNKFGLGKRLEEGFNAFLPLITMMGGVLAIVPAIEKYLGSLAVPISKILHIDPSLLPASILANDSGGFFIAKAMAGDVQTGVFYGMIVSSMLGCTVIFNIPVALGMAAKELHDDIAKGFLFGFISIPVGAVVGGLLLGIPLLKLLVLVIPLVLLSAILAMLLRFCQNLLIKAFTLVGNAITVLAVAGITLSICAHLLQVDMQPYIAPFKDCLDVVASVIIILPGSYVFITLLSRIFRRLFLYLGSKVGINDSSVLGLLSSLSNTLMTFSIVKDMDPRGRIANFAFLTSASFVFGDHLAFCMGVDPMLVLPMVLAKLTAAIFAFALALLLCREKPQ